MPEFFHLTHDAEGDESLAPLKVGAVLRTSDRPAHHFFERVMKFQHALWDDKNERPILEVLRAPDITKFKSRNIAAGCAEIIESHFRAIREYEFEEIRRVEFPFLPSRTKCLWLATDAKDATYWRSRLADRTNVRLLRVRARGVLHLGYDGHLSVEVQSISSLRNAARAYWRGDEHDSGKIEILLEGEMEVLEVLDC